MPEPDPSLTRGGFVEKVALAAGIAAGSGVFLNNLRPESARPAAW
jgi:hypothetical protein